MNKTEFIALIYEWQNIILKRKGVKRCNETAVLSAILSKPIKIITGFRRAGKSFLAQRIAKQLVENEKYKLDNVLYLNFEDYQLAEINTAKKLGEAYSIFTTDVAKGGKRLVILDEVQNVEGWDKFVRTIYEKEDDVNIILTGSNSELLSAELGSNLAGRFIEFFIFPFDFKEFLSYRGIFVKDEVEYLRQRAQIDNSFAEYIKYGGLPEVFEIASEDAKFSYLKGIITKVVLDDIVKRFGVENVDVLERLLNYVLSNIGGQISYTNLKNRIKLLGIDVKVETVIKYIGYFAKTFIIFEVNKFDWKQRKIFSSSKKFFATDVGITSLFRPSRENLAMKLENAAFLHLKKKNNAIFYGANERGREIDFVLRRDEACYDKYQICLNLDRDNLERELGAFDLSDKYLKNGGNFILTAKAEIPSNIFEKHKARHYDIIRWLLDIGEAL